MNYSAVTSHLIIRHTPWLEVKDQKTMKSKNFHSQLVFYGHSYTLIRTIRIYLFICLLKPDYYYYFLISIKVDIELPRITEKSCKKKTKKQKSSSVTSHEVFVNQKLEKCEPELNVITKRKLKQSSPSVIYCPKTVLTGSAISTFWVPLVH